MPSYFDPRDVGVLNVPASEADDTDLACFAEVPAGKSLNIYGLSAFLDGAGTASSTIEVVASDAATTPLCEVAIDGTGAAKDSSTTFPVTVTNSSATDSIFLRFRTNGATGAGADGQVLCHYMYPGVN